MAAKDYTFGADWKDIYLTKKTKPRKDGLSILSTDRRPLDENEILFIFDHYLRHFCDKHNTDTLHVKGEGGKVLFTATLIDKEE